MGNSQSVPLSLYIYAPNKTLPIIFTLLYFLTFVIHTYQCHRDKSWRLLFLLPASGLSFSLGYALRAYNAFDAYIYTTTNATSLLVYILSQVFLYIPPPLLELANYHILGKVLAYIPRCSPLRPKAVMRIFGSVMLVVETVNALGVSLSANPDAKDVTKELGKGLTLAALALQLLVIFTFVVLATTFHQRMRQAGLEVRVVETALITLFASMSLIFVRCVYRMVEHGGNTRVDLSDAAKLAKLSLIMRYEAFFYVFEATLMLVNVGLWIVWNPGKVFGRHVYLGSDGITEVEYGEANKSRSWPRWLRRERGKVKYRLENMSGTD